MKGPTRGPPQRDFLALFAAIMVPMFLAAVDQNLLAAAMPSVAAEFGSLAETVWIAIGYLLATVVAAPVHGRLGDRWGHRRMMLVALALFASGSLSCALATSLWHLAASRVLQGIGGGGLMVLSQGLIGQLVAPRDRPRYQSYFTLVFAVSSIGGPALGGFVVAHASWRWLFVAHLPLCTFAAWRVWNLAVVSPVSAEKTTAFDAPGLIMFAIGAVSGLLWLGQVGHRFALQSVISAVLFSLALVMGLLLWRHQRAHASPFLPVEVLRRPGAVALCSGVAVYGATLFTLIFFLPMQAQVVHGASAATAGLRLLPLTAGVVVGGWFANRWIGRSKLPNQLAPFGMLLSASGVVCLGWLDPQPALASVALVAIAFGLSTVISGAQLALQLLAGRPRLGTAAALVSLSRAWGAATGTAAFGAIAFAFPDRALGFRTALALLAVPLLVCAWYAARLPRLHLDTQSIETP